MPDNWFARSRGVLEHFGVAAEPESQPQASFLDGRQTADAARKLLPIFDPSGSLGPYVTWKDGTLAVFQDPGTRAVADFDVRLAASPAEVVTPGFHARLLAARANPASAPLRGVRVALDPGHMGGQLWDDRTGKHVDDGEGHWISEGIINLQTALLLEAQLRELGAETLVTHRKPGTVSSLAYEALDLHAYGLNDLRESSRDDWFLELLSKGDGPALFKLFDQSAEVKRRFSEEMRGEYYIKGADLDARSELINAFQPDVTLIIHYDTSDPPGNPTGINPRGFDATKAFVAGAFGATELVSRADRLGFARHLLEATSWDASLALSRAVTGSLSKGLGIPLERSFSVGNTMAIEPGVFARNLNLTRGVWGTPLSYVECLFYNDPGEFKQLLRADHSMKMDDGRSYPYSNRLAEVVESLREGVVAFVAGYGR